MAISHRAQWAIDQMRRCQDLEEQYRTAAQEEYKAAKDDLTRAYTRTQRQTLGSFDKTIQRRALADQTRKELVGDEAFYRSLTLMYTGVAQVELALDAARERESFDRKRRAQGESPEAYDLRNVSPPRTERAMG